MFRPGIQTTCSTNWKSAVPRSKSNQIQSEITKVNPEAQMAPQRAPLATSSGSSLRTSTKIASAPSSGRKVMAESQGMCSNMAGQPAVARTYQVTRPTTPISMAKA